MQYTTVIIPIAQQSCYTYAVPPQFQQEIQKGQQVVVPLGRKFYGGIVLSLTDTAPDFKTKPIISIWDKQPIVEEWQIDFWQWIADYYMCEIGEVMAAGLPAGFRIESEHKLHLSNTDYVPNNEKEILLLKALTEQDLDLKTIDKSFSGNFSEIKKLLDKDIVQIQTKHSQRFKAKEVAFLTAKANLTQEKIENLSDLQQHVLLRLLDLSEEKGKVEKSQLLKEDRITASPITTLIKKGFINLSKEKIYRYSFQYPKQKEALFPLSELQAEKLTEIQTNFESFTTVLLHGITSSGKTEIYSHLIAEQLAKGNSVLFLLPEIALTTQLSERLARFFGKQLLVYHSKYSNNERVEIWRKLQENKQPYVIIGARSAVFLPFQKLGLIIVDEEHEPSFKQQDPSPRYHGRDAAIYLAHLCKCKVLLGSATPSFESYFNVHLKKYGLVNLLQRYKNIQPPEIVLVDIAEVSRKKRMKGVFSPQLIQEIQKTLENNEQVILFQNRRGYSYFLKCETCDAIPHCPNCDVSLTLHKYSQRLECHYCNFSVAYQSHNCCECGSNNYQPIGFGTEQIEEQTATLFPDYNIDRIDWDTTTGKNSYEKILSKFADGQTDILIGTQMLAKGLDFDNVGLVAVLNSDLLLNFPDFRAYERSFQLLSQVSGRAGRKKKQGKVLIQTYKPEQPVLQLVQKSDYLSLYNNQIQQRLTFGYPPVYRMIKIKLKHKKEEKIKLAAQFLGEKLKQIFKHRTYGATTPLVGRIQSYYLQEIIVKIERQSSYDRAKTLISQSITETLSKNDLSTVRIGIDVDIY